MEGRSRVHVQFVSPRHLAGAGDPAWVTVPLHRGCGWSHGHDPLTPRVHLSSPDNRALLRLEPTPDKPWWHIQHTRDRDQPAWNASFDAHTPVELIAAVTDALSTPHIANNLDDPNEPLRAAGWSPNAGAPGLFASVDGTTHVTGSAGAPWRISTRLFSQRPWDNGPRPVWQAHFDAGTPPHLVSAFTHALVDETPVMRRSDPPFLRYGDLRMITTRPCEVPAADVAFAIESRASKIAARYTAPSAPPHSSRPGPDNRRRR